MSRGIYTVKGINNTSQAKIIQTFEVDMNQNKFISDELIDSINLFDNVVANIYKSNILDRYLLTTKKLPVIFVKIFINRPLKKISIINLAVCFTILTDVQSESQLTGSKLDGEFTLELIYGQNNMVMAKINTYLGDNIMVKQLINIIKDKNMDNFVRSEYTFDIPQLIK